MTKTIYLEYKHNRDNLEWGRSLRIILFDLYECMKNYKPKYPSNDKFYNYTLKILRDGKQYTLLHKCERKWPHPNKKIDYVIGLISDNIATKSQLRKLVFPQSTSKALGVLHYGINLNHFDYMISKIYVLVSNFNCKTYINDLKNSLIRANWFDRSNNRYSWLSPIQKYLISSNSNTYRTTQTPMFNLTKKQLDGLCKLDERINRRKYND